MAEGGELRAAGLARGLDDLAGLPAHDLLVAVLPGEPAATRALRLPVPDRQVEGAARLAFEDVLADGTDAYVFGWTPTAPDGTRRVTAYPREAVSIWLSALAAAGRDPDTLTLDHGALGAEGYEAVILRERGRVVARLPGGGLTGAESFAAPLATRLAEGSQALSVRIGPSGEALSKEALVLADERALGAFYLAALDREAPVELRKGRLAKRRELSGDLKRWRAAAALLAACVGIWVLGDAVRGWRYGQAADDLEARAMQEFRVAFPDTRIVDLRRQAEQRARAPGGSAFLPLSAALAEALEETGQVTLERLAYAEDGRLVADIRYRDYAGLERLTENLRGRGLAASGGSSARREDDGSYADRLTLETGA